MIEKAKWIFCDETTQTPRISRRFTVDTCQTATIEIAGLGWFELYINGERVERDYFVPPLSDYCERDRTAWTYPIHDTTTHRVYYMTYDVTPYIHAGENTLSVLLGNGWYRQRERICEGNMAFGDELCAVYALTYKNASGRETAVLSDGSETFVPTETVYSQLFIGEIQDFTCPPGKEKSVRLSDWKPTLTPATCPPDRAVRTVYPQLLCENGDVRLYDVGENISGFAVLNGNGKAGEAVLRYGEDIGQDGQLSFASSGAAYVCASGALQIQTDTFRTDGRRAVLAPHFVWHTFRYFTVSGDVYDKENVYVQVIHSDCPPIASFDSDSEALNWLWDSYRRTLLDNMHNSIPSDCPHRERLGYTGDGFLSADAAMTLLDCRTFFAKWIQDILDCQDSVSGHVQHTAPFMGGGGGPCGWGGAIIEVPYRYYRRYGDLDMLQKCYEPMCRYVTYIQNHSDKGLVTREEPGGWCLGDWASPEPMEIPEPYVNSCLFVRLLHELAEIADVLGKKDDRDRFAALANTTTSAVIDAYYHPETGTFCRGKQGEDAFAVSVGIAPDDRTLQNLVNTYKTLGHLDTGFFATNILADVLCRAEQTELLYSVLSTPEMGGYLYMKNHGATTIWEYLNGAESHCHPALGATAQYLLTYFAGIRYEVKKGGKIPTLSIEPHLARKMRYAEGRLALPEGEVRVRAEREEDSVAITVQIPCRAKVSIGENERIMPAGNYRFMQAEKGTKNK